MGLIDQGVAPIKFAAINLTGTGDIVSAVTDKKIRVLGYALVASAAMSINFEDNTTDITGVMAIPANGGISYAGGWSSPAFETTAGNKLAMTISGAGNLMGHLTYVLIS